MIVNTTKLKNNFNYLINGKCMNSFGKIAVFMLIWLVVTNSLSAQNTGTVTGRITSSMTKSPLAGVTIRILNTNLGAVSKKDGTFEIKNVEPGIQKVQFSIIGYETFVLSDVSVGTGKPAYLEVELIEKVIELEGAEVKATFFQKRVDAVTSTQYLNFEDIRRAPGVQEDVIRATALLPGVNVTGAEIGRASCRERV